MLGGRKWRGIPKGRAWPRQILSETDSTAAVPRIRHSLGTAVPDGGDVPRAPVGWQRVHRGRSLVRIRSSFPQVWDPFPSGSCPPIAILPHLIPHALHLA